MESARVFFLRILSILIRSLSPPVTFHGGHPALLSSSSSVITSCRKSSSPFEKLEKVLRNFPTRRCGGDDSERSGERR